MTRGSLLYLALLSVLGALAAGSVVVAPPAEVAPHAPEAAFADTPAADAVQGLWSRWPDKQHEGDPVRFYYFHGDGHGLYRYGRVGLTNTHSFDYRAHGDTLVVTFRKSGARHRLSFQVEVGRDGRRVLHLRDDPEENGAATDYYFVPPPSASLSTSGPLAAANDATKPAGHMWIDLREHATGGVGFSLYQLGPAGIDGRGTGWHHRGDFDDWSTESLGYRFDGSTIELRFDLTGERFRTGYGVAVAHDGKRRLVLHEDPRNWWHRATFTDMGRSFLHDGAAVAFSPRALLEGERTGARERKGD